MDAVQTSFAAKGTIFGAAEGRKGRNAIGKNYIASISRSEDPEPSRKRKGADKPPPATPRLVDKNALSARSGEPRGDADASPTSPPAKSARSSEAGSDEDEGMGEADKGAQMPATQPPEDGSWAAVARRRSPTAAAPAPASEQRGGASALATAAEQRLQAEVGRRAVNISKEIFETAGVPVPPGYVKIKAGGLRRVFKEVAR